MVDAQFIKAAIALCQEHSLEVTVIAAVGGALHVIERFNKASEALEKLPGRVRSAVTAGSKFLRAILRFIRWLLAFSPWSGPPRGGGPRKRVRTFKLIPIDSHPPAQCVLSWA